jgi:hypothetical protein
MVAIPLEKKQKYQEICLDVLQAAKRQNYAGCSKFDALNCPLFFGQVYPKRIMARNSKIKACEPLARLTRHANVIRAQKNAF